MKREYREKLLKGVVLGAWLREREGGGGNGGGGGGGGEGKTNIQTRGPR